MQQTLSSFTHSFLCCFPLVLKLHRCRALLRGWLCSPPTAMQPNASSEERERRNWVRKAARDACKAGAKVHQAPEDVPG